MPPVNDNFADAIELTGTSGGFTVDNTGATAETDDPFAAFWGNPSLPDVWYKIVVTDPITLHMATSSDGTVTDTVLAVYSSSGPAITDLSLLGFDDDGGPGFFSDLTVDLTDSGTYYIVVTGWDETQQGTFDFAWDTVPFVPSPDFDYIIDPSSQELIFNVPGTQTFNITVEENVGPEDVVVTITEDSFSPLPDGVTYEIIPSSNGTTPYSFSISITVVSGTVQGIFTLNLHGVASDGPTHDVQLFIDIVGNSGPRARDALSDIVHITDGLGPNSGLRSLTGGAGVNLSTANTQYGIIEHNGAPYVFFYDLDNSGVKSLGVARFVSGAWEFLGTPFKTGSGETVVYSSLGLQQLQDIRGGCVCSDGTNLFAVSLVLVEELGLGDFPTSAAPNSPVWKMACKKWTGGTGWTDWGWDDAITMNANPVNYTPQPIGTDSVLGFSFDGSAGGDGVACAKNGVVYTSWTEVGITGTVGSHTSGTLHIYYYLEADRYFHIIKLSGPGKTLDRITPHSGVLSTFSTFTGSAEYTPHEWWESSSDVMSANGGTALSIIGVLHVFASGAFDGIFPLPEVWNLETLTIVNTALPSSAIPSGTGHNIPFHLYWDSNTSKYYFAIPQTDSFSSLGYVVSLSADGTVYGLLHRRGSTSPALINFEAAGERPPNGGQVVGIEDESTSLGDVWLFTSINQWPNNLLIYAWLPCPTPGNYEPPGLFGAPSAWEIAHVRGVKNDFNTSDVLVISGSPDPPMGPYIAPIPNGQGATWNNGGGVAVKIGDRIYAITAEQGHVPYLYSSQFQVEYRVYYFEIGRGVDLTSCPIILTGGKQSIFWFFKDGVWHNQNVDPNLSLWFYKDGEWRQDGADTIYELFGQLDTTWQT